MFSILKVAQLFEPTNFTLERGIIRGSSSTCLTFTRFKFDRFLTRRNYNGNKFGIELTRTERSGSPSELEYRSIFSDYVRPFVVTTTFHGSHGAAKKKRERENGRETIIGGRLFEQFPRIGRL